MAFKQQKFVFFPGLEVGSLRSGCQCGQVMTFSCVADFFLYVSLCGGRAKGASWGLFYMSTNPTHGGFHPSKQRPHLLIPSHWT